MVIVSQRASFSNTAIVPNTVQQLEWHTQPHSYSGTQNHTFIVPQITVVMMLHTPYLYTYDHITYSFYIKYYSGIEPLKYKHRINIIIGLFIHPLSVYNHLLPIRSDILMALW